MNHFNVSIIKSAIRIIACIILMSGDFITAGLLLGIAEVFGVVEEIVETPKK